MARHRALAGVRPGIAKWPVMIVSLVALLVLGWLGVVSVNRAADRRAAAQTHACPAGNTVVQVAVTPSIADAVADAARRWNAQDPIVFDRCVQVSISALDTKNVYDHLVGTWDPALGSPPQAWLPESSFWVNRLLAANNALVTSSAESVATSPVVLAVPEEASKPLTDGNSFLYGDLAILTSAPNGWARYGRPEWGRITVGMPDPVNNAASGLAIQCAIAGASPLRSGPVTADTLLLPAVQQNLAQLAASRPDVPANTIDALVNLGTAGKLRDAPYTAVPVTEVDLYRRNLGLDGRPVPAKPLYELAARGPSPAADFPFVTLAADPTQARAVRKFAEFLKEADQQRLFNHAGLRAAGGAEYPRDAPGIRWDSATTSLIPADANTTQQIAETWRDTADGGQVVTILVDVSESMRSDGGDGTSRLDWVKQALHGLANRMATGSLGLWEFSHKLDGGVPYKRLVPTSPVGPQRAILHTGIDSLTPATASHLYTSLDAAYQSAMDSYVPGKRNRVVVITDGGNDGGLTYTQVRDRLKAPGKGKLPVSVIAMGPGTDRAELTGLASATGGQVSVLSNAKGIDGALSQVLSS